MNISSSRLLNLTKRNFRLITNARQSSLCGKTSEYRGNYHHHHHPHHQLSSSVSLSSAVYLNQRRTFTHSAENCVKVLSKDFHVNPGFGVLHVNGAMDFVVKPSSPQEYPDADRAFINIYGPPSATQEGINIELMGEQLDILSITAAPKTPHMYCEVLVPIKYDLDMHLLEDAGLEIAGMEADEVKVSTEKGEIKTKGIKSHNIHIKTIEGNITSEGSLQGNIFINAKKTNFKAKRLQGLVMDIEAEDLTMALESSYMNQGQISAQHGEVKINNLHGCTDLMVRNGSIVIMGFHGQVSGFVGSGRIEAQVTDVTGHSTLHLKEGHLALSILDSPRHNLEVTAPELKVSDDVRKMGKTSSSSSPSTTSSSTSSSPTSSSSSSSSFILTQSDPAASLLKATVKKGSGEIKCQSWFSTLGIKMEREN